MSLRTIVTDFNFYVVDTGIPISTYLQGWINPLTQSLAGTYCTFKRDEISHYSADTSKYVFDAKVGGKIGTRHYWGRLFWRDEKGNTILRTENLSIGGTASFLTAKGESIFMTSTQIVAVVLKVAPYTFTSQLITNYNAASIISSLYMSKDGLKHCVALNNGRLLFFEISSDATTITEMHYDLSKSINSMIPEKPLTSL